MSNLSSYFCYNFWIIALINSGRNKSKYYSENTGEKGGGGRNPSSFQHSCNSRTLSLKNYPTFQLLNKTYSLAGDVSLLSFIDLRLYQQKFTKSKIIQTSRKKKTMPRWMIKVLIRHIHIMLIPPLRKRSLFFYFLYFTPCTWKTYCEKVLLE